jgi:ActR/RegA family two-component response regulator
MNGLRAARAVARSAGAERVLFVGSALDPALVVAVRQLDHMLATASTLAEMAHHLDHFEPTCVLVDLDQVEAGDRRHALLLGEAGPMRRVLLASPAAFFTALEWVAARRAEHVLLKPASPQDVLAVIDPSASAPRLPSLERIQWEYIQAVLGSCQGNVSEAARQLGMFRQSLQRILRRPAPPH